MRDEDTHGYRRWRLRYSVQLGHRRIVKGSRRRIDDLIKVEISLVHTAAIADFRWQGLVTT
jgi:hypothetical protein